MCEREVLPCFCLRAARTFEREFSLGISHQFLGGRPFAILSAVTRPTPLASASAPMSVTCVQPSRSIVVNLGHEFASASTSALVMIHGSFGFRRVIC